MKNGTAHTFFFSVRFLNFWCKCNIFHFQKRCNCNIFLNKKCCKSRIFPTCFSSNFLLTQAPKQWFWAPQAKKISIFSFTIRFSTFSGTISERVVSFFKGFLEGFQKCCNCNIFCFKNVINATFFPFFFYNPGFATFLKMLHFNMKISKIPNFVAMQHFFVAKKRYGCQGGWTWRRGGFSHQGIS